MRVAQTPTLISTPGEENGRQPAGSSDSPQAEETRSTQDASVQESEAPGAALYSKAQGSVFNQSSTMKIGGGITQSRRVTGKDLEEWTERLHSDIFNSQLESRQLTEESVERLKAEIDKLTERVEELNENTEERISRVGEETTVMVDGCNARVDQEIKRVTFQVDEQIARERESYQTLDMMRGLKIMAAEKRLADLIGKLENELSGRLSKLETKLGDNLAESQKRLEGTAETLRAELAARVREASDATARGLSSTNAALQEHQQAAAVLLREVEARVRGDLEVMDEKLEKNAAESRNLHNAGKTEVFTKLTKELDQCSLRLDTLEEQARLLDLSVAAAANMPTRRIEWSISDVTERLAAADGRGAPSFSWSSQDFDVAGANSLRLELRHLSRSTGKLDRGDCVMVLWAPKGLFLIFRLLMGSESVQLEHSFSGDEPYTSDRLCFLKDQVNPDDNTLRVGIEVLEAVAQLSDTRTLRKAFDAGDGPSAEAEMSVHRYLNHRVLELVQDNVDTMKSRMVRRIDWRIAEASALRRYFAEGESMCSATFDAASLHNLQFVFYPTGFLGAREGYCSLFLYCPDGSLLKCWLSIGKVRREVRMSSDQQGFLGRTNFCRFDGCIEADDTLLLTLEIVEAQRSDTEVLVHQVGSEVPGPRKLGLVQHRLCEAPEPEGAAGAAGAGAAGAISSVMRLQQTPEGQVFQDVRLLPSIWTPTPRGNLADSLGGFHAISSIKAMKRPVSSRVSVSAGGLDGGAVTPRSSRASAARRYDMYAK